MSPVAGSRIAFYALTITGALLASGCGGGGGGGGASGGSGGSGKVPVGFPANPPPSDPAADAYVTREFADTGGLYQINAQYAYAEGATGDGVTVALVDTGVDLDHPDLFPNLHPATTDIIDPGTGGQDVFGHGTAVAGIIGSVKNDIGGHGVAFESQILSVRAEVCDPNSSGCSDYLLYDDDIARSIDYAIDNGAKVINLSLAGPGGISPNLQAALERAANEGVIVFASAGNENQPNPLFPAAFATDPRAGGTLIAVGAVDPINQRADFSDVCGNDPTCGSNACGDASEFCLVAPGDPVLAPVLDGTVDAFYGTSGSAPYASGAAAVLMSAFPGLTAKEVVEILLNSAADLGAPGTDEIYGHGVIDLYAAMQPMGTTSVPVAGGTSASFENSALALGPAFGNALAGRSNALSEVVALDDYRRPYKVDLSGALKAQEREIELGGFLATKRKTDVQLNGPAGLNVSFAFDDGGDRPREASSAFLSTSGAGEDGGGLGSFAVAAALDQSTTLHLGHQRSAVGQLAEDPGYRAAGGLFLYGEEALAPHLSLAQSGLSAKLSHQLSEDTALSFGWFRGELAATELPGQDADDDATADVLQVGLSQRVMSDLVVGASFSMVEEDNSFLGTRSSGAFGEDAGARSQFLTLSAELPLTGGLELIASYTQALTVMDDSDASVLNNWGLVQANAFGAGIVSHNLFTEGDRLGFLVSQPLRVSNAEADLVVPVSTNSDGSVNFSSEREDLEPDGREISLQFAYQAQLLPGVDLQGLLLGRLQPGHDSDAKPDLGMALRLDVEF